MDAGRRPVTSLSTKGSPTSPAKLPFCRRCNGVPGCSQGGCNLKFKCRRTESPSARVVTFTGQNPTKHNASRSGRRDAPPFLGRSHEVGHRQKELRDGLWADLQPRSSNKGKTLASNDPTQRRECLSAYLRWERVAGQGGGDTTTLVGTPLPPDHFIKDIE